MRMIKAVLFDMGGVIHVCTRSEERNIWFAKRVLSRLAEYGIVLDTTPEELSARMKVNAEIYKAEVEKTLREMPTEVFWNDYLLKEYNIGRERLSYLSEELSFLYDYERVCNMRRPNLIETMEKLRDMGLRIGVISNIVSTTIVSHFMKEYGLEKYLDCVLDSANTGIRKPDASIFRLAEAAMQLNPDEMAYVGDTISRDVRGVRNAGWKIAIQIPCESTARRDACMKGLGYAPDYLIEDLMEIPAIIAKHNQNA